jgi:hypothetical protein
MISYTLKILMDGTNNLFTIEYARSIAGKCELYEAIRKSLEKHIRTYPKSDYRETFWGDDFYDAGMPDVSFIEDLFKDFNCKLTITSDWKHLAKIEVYMDSKTWSTKSDSDSDTDDYYGD